MSEPFLGQITMFAGNFAPRGWAFCNGQLLPISSNSALFSLLGTNYGGDGRTTFGLPDLRGRVPVNSGSSGVGSAGPGLTARRLGEQGGSERVTLTTNQLPSHTHDVAPRATNDEQTTNRPVDGVPARGGSYAAAGTESAASVTSTATGGGQPVENMPPYLAINFIIALQGTFPSRS